jgi:hypothetical protein
VGGQGGQGEEEGSAEWGMEVGGHSPAPYHQPGCSLQGVRVGSTCTHSGALQLPYSFPQASLPPLRHQGALHLQLPTARLPAHCCAAMLLNRFGGTCTHGTCASDFLSQLH